MSDGKQSMSSMESAKMPMRIWFSFYPLMFIIYIVIYILYITIYILYVTFLNVWNLKMLLYII